MAQAFYQRIRLNVYNVLQNPDFDSPLSRAINIALISLILINVGAILIESVDTIYRPYQIYFDGFEQFILIVFTLEFLLRLWCVASADSTLSAWHQRKRWLMSGDAFIDLISIVPAYINYFVPIDLGIFRLLRLLRLLKLARHFNALQLILQVVRRERDALQAVLLILFILIILAAGGMYVVEHEAQPEDFGSIPQAMWWAVVTLTTVGYGDVTPVTTGGKIFGAMMTILGVGLAALPAGILATGLAAELREKNHRAEEKFRALLTHHQIDLGSNPDKLEQLRKQAGLGKEEAHDIILQLMREEFFRHRPPSCCYCPHCGEKLPD